MKVACVLLTHLRAKVEIRRHPHLKDNPVVIVDRDSVERLGPLVVDQFPGASGVVAGMTIEQAMSQPFERRRVGRRRDALPPGFQAGPRFPSRCQ